MPPPAARLRVAAASVARRPGGLQQPLRAPPRRTAVQLSPSTALQVDFIHANRWQLIKLAAVAAVATLSAVSVPLAFSRVLSTLTAVDGFTMPELVRRLAVMVVLHTVEPCMTVLYVQQSAALIDRFVTSLRARVYATLLRREVAAFEATDASPAATATQLVVGEVDRVKTAAMQNLSRDRGLRAGLELVAGLTILYTLCWPLAVMFNVVVPITSYISSRFGKRLFAATVAENHAGLRQAARAAETIGNFKEVFSFSNQPLEEARFATVQVRRTRRGGAASLRDVTFHPSLSLLPTPFKFGTGGGVARGRGGGAGQRRHRGLQPRGRVLQHRRDVRLRGLARPARAHPTPQVGVVFLLLLVVEFRHPRPALHARRREHGRRLVGQNQGVFGRRPPRAPHCRFHRCYSSHRYRRCPRDHRC